MTRRRLTKSPVLSTILDESEPKSDCVDHFLGCLKVSKSVVERNGKAPDLPVNAEDSDEVTASSGKLENA